MSGVFSHVKWFNDVQFPEVDAFHIYEWLLIFLIVIMGLIVLKVIDTWLNKSKITAKLDKKFKPYRPWVPLVVRLSTAVLLLVNASLGYMLAPNVVSDNSGVSTIITGLFIVAAVLIALGLLTKVGVIALLVGYLLVTKQAEFIDVFDHFEYIGVAGYLWLRGPGRYSVDSYLKKGKLVMPDIRKYSLGFYRISVGFGFTILALSEKLFNVSASQDFLNQHSWNFMSFVGFSDRYFILLIGAVELLIGIALIFNLASRLLMLSLLCIMIATALLLGVEEIYGHLFAVGVVVAVLVNDKNPAKYS